MQLWMVGCRTEQHQEDDESRKVAVLATNADQAIELCRAKYGDDGFTTFTAEFVSGDLGGSAQVIGYTGQREPWPRLFSE
jgi:hypothetical protein